MKKKTKLKKSTYFSTLFRNISIDWSLLFVLAVIITIFISHTFYVIKTHQYPWNDEHVYTGLAVNFYDIITHPSFESFKSFANSVTDRQPIYSLVGALVFLFIGTDHAYKTMLWINVLFYSASIYGIYLVSKEFLSKSTSSVVSLIFAFYGFNLFFLHFVFSETPTTTFVIYSLLFLLKSNKFHNTKQTIIFACFFALGCLVRWVTPLFLVGPILLNLLLCVKTVGEKKKERGLIIKNILFFFLIGIAIPALLYYVPKFNYFQAYIMTNVNNGANWTSSTLSPNLRSSFNSHSLLFYMNTISQQSIYFFLLFVIGFILALRKYKKYSVLILGFLFSYILFTISTPWKDNRFILPIYPYMAIISGIAFEHISNKKIKVSLLVLSCFMAIFTFLGSTWGIGPMGSQGLKDIVMPSFIHPRRIYLTSVVWPPEKEYTNAYLAFNTIANDRKNVHKKVTVLNTFSFYPFDNAFYTLGAYERRDVMDVKTLRGIDPNDYKTFFQLFTSSEYIMIKSPSPIDSRILGNNPQKEQYMYKMFNYAFADGKLPRSFVILRQIFIPADKTKLIIYKKIRNISQDELQEFASYLIQKDPRREEVIKKAVSNI